MRNNWSDIFKMLLFRGPLCFMSSNGSCRERLLSCFIPRLRLDEGYGVKIWGAEGHLKVQRMAFTLENEACFFAWCILILSVSGCGASEQITLSSF